MPPVQHEQGSGVQRGVDLEVLTPHNRPVSRQGSIKAGLMVVLREGGGGTLYVGRVSKRDGKFIVTFAYSPKVAEIDFNGRSWVGCWVE